VVPVTDEVNVTGIVAVLLHSVWLVGVTDATGIGFTVIVNDWAVPVQPFAEGVTVTIDEIGVLPGLLVGKELISPVPRADSPVAVLLLVHEYTVPGTAPVKLNAPVTAPLQYTAFAGTVTVGVGFTVSVKVCVVPGHPVDVGITLITAAEGAAPVFVIVNAAMLLPVPELASPMLVLLLFQV
jgi:hypothetical protein